MEVKIMYGLISEDYLMHHGVKGMKWGVRNDPERVGRIRGSSRESPTRVRSSNTTTLNRRKVKKALKVGSIVAGAALSAGAGAYLIKSGKVSSVAKIGKAALSKTKPAGRIKNAGMQAAQKTLSAAWKTKRAGIAAKTIARETTRFVRVPAKRAIRVGTKPLRLATRPIRRVTNPVTMPVRNAVRRMPVIGQTALKAYAAATLASDMSSVYQWANKSKKQGGITKEDTKKLVKDILNPIPNNIPIPRKEKK